MADTLALLPVPATALVLFVVVAAVLPKLGPASEAALRVLPVYIAFAIAAPLLGWWLARRFGLGAAAGRAVAFSSAVPGAVPVLPAIIVAQTLVELLGELVYVRWIARWGSASGGEESAGHSSRKHDQGR